MGQSVRTKNSTTILPSDDLKGSTVLPSRSSAKACGGVCGAPNPQINNMTQTILSTGICAKYMAAGNSPPPANSPILHGWPAQKICNAKKQRGKGAAPF